MKKVMSKVELPREKELKKFSEQELKQIVTTKVLKIVSEAFRQLEFKNNCVCDMVMSLQTFKILCKYSNNLFEANDKRIDKRSKGFQGHLWGAKVWTISLDLGKTSNNSIYCFSNNKQLGEKFPSIIEAKKFLKIEC
jgi:hypothetical protein